MRDLGGVFTDGIYPVVRTLIAFRVIRRLFVITTTSSLATLEATSTWSFLMNPRSYAILLVGVFNILLIIHLITTPIIVTDTRPWYTTLVPGPVEPLDPAQRVLLPSYIEPWCAPKGFWGAAAVWRPSAGQIAQLESDLGWFLPQVDSLTAAASKSGRPRLTTYYRQYFGLQILGESPVIYVNAFVQDEYGTPGRWRREMVCMEDGGDWFWHIEYDPVGRRFRRFGFNGTA